MTIEEVGSHLLSVRIFRSVGGSEMAAVARQWNSRHFLLAFTLYCPFPPIKSFHFCPKLVGENSLFSMKYKQLVGFFAGSAVQSPNVFTQPAPSKHPQSPTLVGGDGGVIEPGLLA